MTEVQFWTISLEQPRNRAATSDILSSDEIARADRFLAERDRHRFIACRAALRRIVAGLLDSDPATIQFQYSPFGKPALAGEHASEIHFNVSHSDDAAMISVARGRAIGVDVERMRPDFASEELARRFFSASERATLERLPTESRIEAFYRCWTRKEAFIKAVGQGLTYPLDAFDVTLAPDEPARLLRVGHDRIAAERWSLHDLPAPPGFVAALAVEGRIERVVPRTDFI